MVKPALRQPEPPPRETWWAKPEVQRDRPAFNEEQRKAAERMNAEKTYVPRAGDFQ